MFQIIRIRRAKVSSYNKKFRELRDDTNCCTELTIQTNTTIEFIHGTFESKTDNITTTSLPPPVTLLSEVSDTDGKIRELIFILTIFDNEYFYFLYSKKFIILNVKFDIFSIIIFINIFI